MKSNHTESNESFYKSFLNYYHPFTTEFVQFNIYKDPEIINSFDFLGEI